MVIMATAILVPLFVGISLGSVTTDRHYLLVLMCIATGLYFGTIRITAEVIRMYATAKRLVDVDYIFVSITFLSIGMFGKIVVDAIGRLQW